MKYLKIILVFLTFTFLSASPASSQIWKKYAKEKEKYAKNRAADKADQKVDNTIDKGIDKAFEGVGNMFKKGKSDDDQNNEDQSVNDESGNSSEHQDQAQAERNRKLMEKFMGGGDVKTEDSYTFKYHMKTKSTSYNKNGKETASSVMVMSYPGKDHSYMSMKTDTNLSRVIMDFTNKVMLSFTQQHNVVAIKMDGMDSLVNNVAEDENSQAVTSTSDPGFTYKKTGRTKMIAGYKCEEVITETDESKSDIWITKDLPFSVLDFYRGMSQAMSDNIDRSYGKLGGYPMEVSTVDKQSGEKNNMIVEDVSTNTETINMSDYHLMSLGNMGNSGKKDK